MPNLLIVFCVILVLASALGGALPTLVTFTHRRIQMTLSLVSGVMLGVAFLHMLPHAIGLLNNQVQTAMFACLAGLLSMFLLIRTFHFHQHDYSDEANSLGECAHHEHHPQSAHHHHCEHGHEHPHSKEAGGLPVVSFGDRVEKLPEEAEGPIRVGERESTGERETRGSHWSWLGLTIGLALHSLMDGLALAAAYTAERSHGGWAALGTFLAILLHKPLDSFTITSLMAARKASFSQQVWVNMVFALVCPLGAILFWLSFESWTALGPGAVGGTLAFSAGAFLCISLGDLLPEVHFHSHDRVPLSLMLLLGILIALGIEFITGHSHGVVVSQ